MQNIKRKHRYLLTFGIKFQSHLSTYSRIWYQGKIQLVNSENNPILSMNKKVRNCAMETGPENDTFHKTCMVWTNYSWISAKVSISTYKKCEELTIGKKNVFYTKLMVSLTHLSLCNFPSHATMILWDYSDRWGILFVTYFLISNCLGWSIKLNFSHDHHWLKCLTEVCDWKEEEGLVRIGWESVRISMLKLLAKIMCVVIILRWWRMEIVKI